jgi:hypothetical protein
LYVVVVVHTVIQVLELILAMAVATAEIAFLAVATAAAVQEATLLLVEHALQLVLDMVAVAVVFIVVLRGAEVVAELVYEAFKFFLRDLAQQLFTFTVLILDILVILVLVMAVEVVQVGHQAAVTVN